MKRTTDSESGDPHDDMLPEYQFDYGKAKPNRFADSVQRRRLAVVLDEDVAEIFVSTEAVNKALRAIIEAMPRTAKRGI